MDPFHQLLDLRQGSSSIVEYIIQFCEITYKVHFDEVMLKDIFRFGLNEPIKSGFVRSWKTWKSHGILKPHFPGLEKFWKNE